jgi:hypothetical protein
MSMRIMFSSVSKRAAASALASSVFPTPVGPRKMNEPDRPARILDTGPSPDDRVGNQLNRLVLTNNPLVQHLVNAQQLLALTLLQPRHRNAGPPRHDRGNFICSHDLAQQPMISLFACQPFLRSL